MVRCRTSLLFGLTLLAAVQAQGVRWRDDLRCGAKENPVGEFEQFLLPNGQVAECDPNSEKPCCSSWSYCGGGIDENGFNHCKCDTCTDYRVIAQSIKQTALDFPVDGVTWRSDLRCGAKTNPSGEFQHFALPTGQTAECDPNSETYCCSAFGYCGGGIDENGFDHCTCPTCVNYKEKKRTTGAAISTSTAAVGDNYIKWRADRRCGLKPDPTGKPMSHLLGNGAEAECNPSSDNYCCSGWGYCGPEDHCGCDTCVDYRALLAVSGGIVPEVKEYWRKDRRCGDKAAPNGDPIQYLLPNGQASECNPNSENYCCSAWGFCGGPEPDKNGADHCSCDTCQNYRENNPEFLGLDALLAANPDIPVSSGSFFSQPDSVHTVAEPPRTSQGQPQTFSRPITTRHREVEVRVPVVQVVATTRPTTRRRRPLRRRPAGSGTVATGGGRGTFVSMPDQGNGKKFTNGRRFPGAA